MLLDDEYSSRAVGPTPDGESGCTYCWCLDIKMITITQFMIGFCVSAVGYPFTVALLGSIFSKVVGNYHQGFYMGLLTMCGSFARVVGPILFVFIYNRSANISLSCD